MQCTKYIVPTNGAVCVTVPTLSRDRPARLDRPESSIIGYPMFSSYFTIDFEFFLFVVEYLKRIQNSFIAYYPSLSNYQCLGRSLSITGLADFVVFIEMA
jgi:hypothetical protein